MERLSDLNIDREDIIETYRREPRIYEEYLRIKGLLEKGLQPAEIARELRDEKRQTEKNPKKLTSYYATVRRKAAIYSNGSTPRSLKGAMRLESLGLLPMQLDNLNLPLLNLLASATFWRGINGKLKNSTSSISRITMTDCTDHEKAVKKILDELNCNWSEYSINRTERRKSKKPESSIGYEPIIGRLIELMGYSLGKKMDNELLFPDYIQAAFNSFADITTSQEEKHMAFDILHDFILSLLFFRARYASGNNAWLNTFQTEVSARKQARQVSRIARTVLPGFKFTASKLKIHKETGTHFSCLWFSGKQATKESIKAHYFRRIEEAISQSRKVSFKIL